MLDSKVLLGISRKIRAARLEKNLTIQQVADRSQVTKGLVSKIENGRTIPSLPVFVSIVQSLGLTLSDFFNGMSVMHDKSYLHIRREDYTDVAKESRPGFHYRHILSQVAPSTLIDVSLLVIEPGAKSTPISTDGYEIKFVISGECRYLIDDEVIDLRAGDVLFFDGSAAHAPVNNGSLSVTMLVIYLLGRNA